MNPYALKFEITFLNNHYYYTINNEEEVVSLLVSQHIDLMLQDQDLREIKQMMDMLIMLLKIQASNYLVNLEINQTPLSSSFHNYFQGIYHKFHS